MARLSTILSLILTRIATTTNIRSIDDSIGQPPLIVEGPSAETIIYRAGQRLTLPCRASGWPPPRYHWYLNGQLIDTLLDNEASFYVIHPANLGNLHIKTRHLITNGDYQCLASNDFGIDMSNITRLQEAVFEDLQPRRLITNLTAIDGRHLVLRCNHVTSVPPPTVYWFTAEVTSRPPRQMQHGIRTNERLTTDDTGGLVIIAVTKSDAKEDFVYKCEAYNYVMRQTSGGGYFKIQVQEEPYSTGSAPELIFSSTKVIGHSGRNATLTCIFSGRPLPRIDWTRKGGVPLPPSAKITDFGRRLVLIKISFDDEGIYFCSAVNENAVTQSSVSLSIVASPSITVIPESRNTTSGRSESFTCQGQGRPSPSVTWFVNAQPITSSSVNLQWEIRDESLILHNLQSEDTSTITCNVTNDLGYVLASAYLIVHPRQSTLPVVTNGTVTETSMVDSDVIMTSVTSSFDGDDGVEIVSDDLNEYEVTFSAVITNSSSKDHVTAIIFSDYDNGASVFSIEKQKKSEADGRNEDLKRINSFLVKSISSLTPLLLVIVFGLIVWRRCRNRKTSYRVEEQEKRHGAGGANGVDYDSEDSGYDDQRAADRSVKKFKMAEN